MSSCVYAVGVWLCVYKLELALGIVNLFIWLSLAGDELSCLIIENSKRKHFLYLQSISCVFKVIDGFVVI